MPDQKTRLEAAFAGRSLHRISAGSSGIYDRCTPECRVAIGDRIRQWLAADPETVDGVLSLHLQDAGGKSVGIDGYLHFHRAEASFVYCANGWQVFRVAWSSDWPDIVSVPMGIFTLNDFKEGELPPNYVRHERECKPSDEPMPDIPVTVQGTL